jgi:hypothetical protein
MGSQLGKSKSVSISGKTSGQEKAVIITSNGTTSNEGIKQVEKKIKKDKKKNFYNKLSKTNVDKGTNTDGYVISPSSTIKRLVGASGCVVHDNLSYDAHSTQEYSGYRCETPSKDVLELRDACVRRGIISAETISVTVPISNEQDYQENNLDTAQESTNETTTTTKVVTDNEQVQNEQQVES